MVLSIYMDAIYLLKIIGRLIIIAIKKLNNNMPKYKIEKQIIFSRKTEKEICAFLDSYEGFLNLTEITDEKGNTALHQCAYFDTCKLLEKYLKYMEYYLTKKSLQNPSNLMFQFINQHNLDGLTPLHFAAYKGHIKIIQILQKYGADVYALTQTSGQNALHLAAQNDKVETFIYFQSTININSKDKKRYSPLHWAAFMNSQSVVTFLLAQKDIEVDSQDSTKQTPLHFATTYGNTKIVKKLLRAGADRSLQNSKKQTAMKIARDNQFKNIEKLLSENSSLFSKIKICMNLQTDYRPKDKEMSKPIIFIIMFICIVSGRFLLFNPGIWSFIEGQDKPILLYVQFLANIFLLCLYITLLFSETKKPPKTYTYFLNVQPNIPLKNVCLICIREKPLRSVHCDICKVCVGRYDHHCYWINNCVGQYNHNRFLGFIVFFFVFLLYLGFLGVKIIYNLAQQNQQVIYIYLAKYQFKSLGYLYSVICLIIFAIFVLPMAMLVGVQIKNLFLNKTTYERFTRDKISSFSESNSHLLSEQIKKHTKNKKKSWSFLNARKMMCSEETDITQNINRSSLVENLSDN